MQIAQKVVSKFTVAILVYSIFLISVPAKTSQLRMFDSNTKQETNVLSNNFFAKSLNVVDLNEKNDEIKTVVKKFNDREFEVELSSDGKILGNVLSVRDRLITKIEYTASSGKFFNFEILRGKRSDSFLKSIITTNGNRVEFSYNELIGKTKISKSKRVALRSIQTELVKNIEVEQLIKSSTKILDYRGQIRTLGGVDCVTAVTDCILAAAAYLGGIGTLIAMCPEGFGLPCVAAILLHPVLAVAVGAKCSKVSAACSEVPQSGNEV